MPVTPESSRNFECAIVGLPLWSRALGRRSVRFLLQSSIFNKSVARVSSFFQVLFLMTKNARSVQHTL